jgi:hypothetical protein
MVGICQNSDENVDYVKGENFLIRQLTGNYSMKTLLHGVSRDKVDVIRQSDATYMEDHPEP